jgi:hypothetical protein
MWKVETDWAAWGLVAPGWNSPKVTLKSEHFQVVGFLMMQLICISSQSLHPWNVNSKYESMEKVKLYNQPKGKVFFITALI